MSRSEKVEIDRIITALAAGLLHEWRRKVGSVFADLSGRADRRI